MEASAPVALVSPSAQPSPSPTEAPEPTPIFVRFDIENGPKQVMVWMTSDRGAEARNLAPGERKTMFVPLFEGTNIDVYLGGCDRIAHIDWIPGTTPSTIVLKADASGDGYLIEVHAGVSGTPVPEPTREEVFCSG